MFKTLAVACTLGLALGHTQEEINRKGAEVMEEYRTDRGHWVSLTDSGMVDHMVDHIGANGFAVAGFFLTKHQGGKKSAYHHDMPGEEEQESDEIFRAYKKMAKDQSWLSDLGLGHKTWTFGYGHMKDVAEQAGCSGVGTRPWDHVCIIVWKTSADGTHMQTAHTTHFGLDFSKPDGVPGPDDVKKFIYKHAKEAVKAHGGEL